MPAYLKLQSQGQQGTSGSCLMSQVAKMSFLFMIILTGRKLFLYNRAEGLDFVLKQGMFTAKGQRAGGGGVGSCQWQSGMKISLKSFCPNSGHQTTETVNPKKLEVPPPPPHPKSQTERRNKPARGEPVSREEISQGSEDLRLPSRRLRLTPCTGCDGRGHTLTRAVLLMGQSPELMFMKYTRLRILCRVTEARQRMAELEAP